MPYWKENYPNAILIYLAVTCYAMLGSPTMSAVAVAGLWLVAWVAVAKYGARTPGSAATYAVGAISFIGFMVWWHLRPTAPFWTGCLVFLGLLAVSILVSVGIEMREQVRSPHCRPLYAVESCVIATAAVIFVITRTYWTGAAFMQGLILHSGILAVVILRNSRVIVRSVDERVRDGYAEQTYELASVKARGTRLFALLSSFPSVRCGLALLTFGILGVAVGHWPLQP